MAREIFEAATDGKRTHLILKTESAGGGRFSSPANLYLCRVENRHLDSLKTGRIPMNPNVEILETAAVDQRNQGPNSHFGRKLQGMSQEVSRFAAAAGSLDRQVEHEKGPEAAGAAVDRWHEQAHAMTPEKAVALADAVGSVEIRDGVRLSTGEDLARSDDSRSYDQAPYWLSHDELPGPVAISGAHSRNLIDTIDEGARRLEASDWEALDRPAPQEDLEMTPERAVDLADRQGAVEIWGDTWLHTSADLQSDQEGWDDEDLSKSTDFSTSEYWLTTGDGEGPFAISGKDDPDLVECFSEGGRTLTQDEQKTLAGGGRQQAQEKALPTLEGAKVDMSRPFEERLAEMNKLGPMTKEREAERLAAHREEKKQKAQAPAPEARPEAPVKRRSGLDF